MFKKYFYKHFLQHNFLNQIKSFNLSYFVSGLFYIILNYNLGSVLYESLKCNLGSARKTASNNNDFFKSISKKKI